MIKIFGTGHKENQGLGRILLGWLIMLSVLPLLTAIVLSYVIDLKNIVLFIFVILAATVVMVFPISMIISGRILRPIKRLSQWASQVAKGELRQKEITSEAIEISEMGKNFNSVVQALQELTEVSDAVSTGDYSQSVRIRSENDTLGKAVNKMTVSLKNNAWIKDGLAELNNRMQGKLAVREICRNILQFLTSWLNAEVGIFYLLAEDGLLTPIESCGMAKRSDLTSTFEVGEGIVGKSLKDNQIKRVSDITGDHIRIRTGMGEITPRSIIAVPLIYSEKSLGVIELASMHEFSQLNCDFLESIRRKIAIAVSVAESREKLEELLGRTQQQAEELQAQQEELRVTNEQPEERPRALQEQKISIQQKNEELKNARNDVEAKAKELELSSKYKSEFLANMSHELRTPLNSILILSKLLADKGTGLKKKFREYAGTIHDSGSDLLALINEILDLSKIEAGMMEIRVEKVNLKVLVDNIKRIFSPVAGDKNLSLNIEMSKNDLPEYIHTDSHRFQQVLNNLLSNAFKFTEKGGITVRIHRPSQEEMPDIPGLSPASSIAVTVSDTGIGIPEDKLKVIFDAFQQKDGTTARKYGGTGLGLAISKELARLLGGAVHLIESTSKGSTFTLYSPINFEEMDILTEQAKLEAKALLERRNSDLDRRNSDDRRQTPFREIPRSGDRRMSDIRRTGPKERRRNPRNIIKTLRPISREIGDDRRELQSGDKLLLIIQDNNESSRILIDLIRDKGFKYVLAEDGETGLHFADFYKPSGILLDGDVGENGMTADEIKERLQKNPETRAIPIHGILCDDTELLPGAALFLHRLEKELPEAVKEEIRHDREAVMKDKKILIVDDDMRNVFALTSILEKKGLKVIVGANGKKGLEKLRQERDIDLVLMDIMMPVMDGYETIREIRLEQEFRKLPIIALTAKAMKGDRSKTISAGANDYLAKPVDADKLLSLVRVWLYK
ncbi:MAG: response regulator [bacterium]|nr:response regulator [bacterium]